MRTSFLLLLCVVAVICCAIATPAAALLREWKPIKNIDDKEIQGLGEWAVAEHLKWDNDGIKFKKVVSGRMQTVSGVKYQLAIRGLNIHDEERMYRAVVHQGASPNRARKLVYFSVPRCL